MQLVSRVSMLENGPQPESSPQKTQENLPEFVKDGEFDPDAGFDMQLRVADGIAKLIDPNVDPKGFERMTYGFDEEITGRGLLTFQELLVRDATKRLIAMVALMVADGDPKKADKLLGNHDEFRPVIRHLNTPDFDFGRKVQNYIEKNRPLKVKASS